MYTPQQFIVDIEDFLDENEINIDSLSINSLNEEEYSPLFENSLFRFSYGATRGCFIPMKEPKFAFKFDLQDLDELYCSTEAVFYQDAIKNGLQKCFMEIHPFDGINNTSLYLCEYIEKTSSASNVKISRRTREMIQEYTSKHKNAPHIPKLWTSEFIKYYGLKTYDKFLDFIIERGINDLHDCNIGYTQGRPIVFDYAGFYEET